MTGSFRVQLINMGTRAAACKYIFWIFFFEKQLGSVCFGREFRKLLYIKIIWEPGWLYLWIF